MNKSRHNITLDLSEPVSDIKLNAKKGDTAREIVVRLCERGKPYEISDGCTAEFVMMTSLIAAITEQCQIVDDYILYQFTGDETANAGVFECEIILREGSEQITTPSFLIAVEDVITAS